MSRNATQSFVAGAYRNATICPSPITGGLFRSAILSFSATDQINVSFRWAGKTTGAGAPKAHHNSTSDDLVQRLADIGLGLDDPRKRWRSFERFPAVLVCFESELGRSFISRKTQGRAFKRKKRRLQRYRLRRNRHLRRFHRRTGPETIFGLIAETLLSGN